MDNQAILGNGLSTLHNPHPSSHPLRPPGTSFDLGRLPYELRTLVIRAAEVLHTEDCRHLLLVNREFHQVVSPHHWSRIVIDARRPIAELEFLVETILTRYGLTVREVLLYGAGHTSGQFSNRTEELVGQAMDKVANLTSLTCNALMKVVAVSTSLVGLTHLSFGVGIEQRPDLRAIAAIIGRCPLLRDLRMGIQSSTELTGRALMVAAVASRTLLTTLILEECDWILASTVATTQWKCPITRLVILDGDASHLSLPTFRTFVSPFFATLDELSVLASYETWIDGRTPLTPISLPTLTTLELVAVTGAVEMLPLLDLFSPSPLSTVTVVSYEPVSRIPTMDTSIIHSLKPHASTLKRLNVNWDVTSTILGELGIEGVEICDCSSKYGRDEDEDSVEEDDGFSDEFSDEGEVLEVDEDQSEEESGEGEEDEDD